MADCCEILCCYKWYFTVGLPVPREKSSSKAAVAEDEIEDFIRKNTERQKASIALEKKPSGPKKRKIVKISAPKLNDVIFDRNHLLHVR